jgi:hypothetical protein
MFPILASINPTCYKVVLEKSEVRNHEWVKGLTLDLDSAALIWQCSCKC